MVRTGMTATPPKISCMALLPLDAARRTRQRRE
jgi:hypothetical protein